MSTFHETFEIGGTPVGGGAPCYIIAEAGANHDRDLDVARELIDVAADAGADAVKFQTYTGQDLYSSRTPAFDYLEDDRTPQQLLDDIALPREWQPLLADHARERGIHFFSSPFDRAAVDSLKALGVPAMKIASFEIVDLGLIEHAAGAGVPIILSTGMATYGEIEEALAAVARAGNPDVALLRCASVYPSPPEIMNIRAMPTLRRAFGVPAGLSDHTTGIATATGAAALQMDVLEKHFTLSRDREGPDHPFAIEPDELKALVANVREVEAALGTGRMEGPSALEAREMHGNARRSVIAAVEIPKGTEITEAMLTVKRPGFGIKPRDLQLVVGRTARVDIPFDEIVTWEMV
ncbi:N-acetylneuraminate synthase family protein [Patulibacter minatonensis]|uniref:N-acetylneuraminate synthase family protein n=1 Tax=Patulibacter minatonensis TaxID=298163 RepID=UPI00068853AE|nr:N-acetylneuraminate synthase family protein [Patulibacter minatonensis]